MTISKKTLTLSLPSSAARTQMIDLNGKLSALHFRNISFTSDVKITAWRSSSTHVVNRIVCAPCRHGTTQWIYRPRWGVRLGTTAGSTTFGRIQSTSMAFAMMEFADEPLVVRMSTHWGGSLECVLTAYLEN